MNDQITQHKYKEGFEILILDGELNLNMFWMPSAFNNDFTTFLEI